MRYPVNLKQSLNTSSLDQDVKTFADGEHRQLEGIERDGGLTNAYRQDIALTAGAVSVVSDNGKLIEVGPVVGSDIPVKLDGKLLGYVDPFGVTARSQYSGAMDACVTNTRTILVLYAKSASGGIVTLKEYDPDGTLLNSRDVNFGTSYDRASIIHYDLITYASPLECFLGAFTTFKWAREGVGTANFTMAGARLLIAPYVYKYEAANQYLVSSPAEGLAAVGNIPGAAALVAFNARYFVRQTQGGYTRHIVTKTPVLNAGAIEAVGIIGHNTFLAAFTAAPAWQSPAAVTAVDASNRCTYGGVEGFPTVGGAILGITAPEFNVASYTGLYGSRTAGDTVPIDFHGQIANNNGVGASGVGMGIRLNMLNGVPSHFSATPLYPDSRGVVISPVGEFDATYTPSVYGPNDEPDKLFIYRYAGTFFAIELGGFSANPIQKVARDIWRINTIGIMGIVDANLGRLCVAGDDYHGQIAYVNGSGTTRTLYAMKAEAPYSKSIDVGERSLLSAATVGPVNANMVARSIASTPFLPVAQYGGGAVAEEYYKSWVYVTGTSLVGQTFVDSSLSNTLYIGDTVLPIPAGAVYDDRSAILGQESFVREINRDEYLIGNKVQGVYDFFELFGNLYGYTEGTIWLFSFSVAGFIQDPQAIARGQALQLIATSPTVIWFLSTWDNSLYTFDGGRSLTKAVRMSQAPGVIKGAYNVAENALTLDTTTALYFVRDGLVSSFPKNADMLAGVQLWSADDGVHIVATAFRYKYNYNATGTVQPLRWKSSYFGRDGMMLDYLRDAVFTIYQPDKIPIHAVFRAECFNEDGEKADQIEAVTINPVDYSPEGYYRHRIQPAFQQAIGSAVGVEITEKAVLLDVSIKIEPYVDSTIASERSS